MSSKIKVDTIENVAGSGNVSLGSGHNLVVPGNITGQGTAAITSNATVGGTLAVTGETTLTGGAKVNTLKHTGGTTGLTINSSGLVLPKTPILQIRATNTDQAISASTITKVQWQTVEIDTLGAWDSSNNRYTPTVAGYYLCSGSLRFSTTTAERFRSWISKNGNTSNSNQSLHVGFQHSADTINNSTYPLATGLLEMNGSSDYIEVYVETEENITLHDATYSKSFFFAQLVHAT